MNNAFKILTCILIFGANVSFPLSFATLVEEKFNTHLRWNIYVEKKRDILITKTGDGFYIEISNQSFYKKLKEKLNDVVKNKGYFKGVKFKDDGLPSNPAQIKVNLSSESIELFSFYRPQDKKYILDFWIDKSGRIAQKPKNKKAIIKNSSKAIEVPVIRIKPKNDVVKNSKIKRQQEKKYRDFRYGASLIWDYPALEPKIKKKIDIKSKTPEYFYPIKDINPSKNSSKDNHLRLTINLYRNKKYGLMSKSIQLFEKKYGLDAYNDINNFMKSLALIKENFNRKNQAPFRSAISLLESIVDRTKNYKLKKAIYFYLIDYYTDTKNSIKSLEKSKELYVESKVESDISASGHAANVILDLLCQLGQIEKINKFSSESLVQKLISPQKILAYKIATFLKDNKPKRVIEVFEKSKSSLQKPIDPSILYNVSESYFRTARYKSSIKGYQDFLKSYSHIKEASFARVRLALAYEILDNSISNILKHYENAINATSDFNAQYEAKLRYVALRNTRKINPNQSDAQVMSFLDHSVEKKEHLSKNLRNLLWLVRLRAFINFKKYNKALSYITASPLGTLNPRLKRIFHGDGAEIIYGIIINLFEKGEMEKVVKIWEMYKDIYVRKVNMRPYLSFIVARSYIELGLEDSSQLVLTNLKKADNSSHEIFPLWISRVNYGTIQNLSSEIVVLKMFRNKKWESIIKNIDQLNISDDRKLFYEAVSLYNLKYFDRAVKISENLLINSSNKIPLDKEETRKFFEAYLESLYATANLDKFKKTSRAILKDIESFRNSHLGLLKLAEKTRYLLLESLSSSKNKNDHLAVELDAEKFLKDYTRSIYKDRVKFLWASSLLINKKESTALKILNQLVESDKTAGYIREISKTEITNLKFREGIFN